jgi:beta-galactosidase
MRLFRLLAAVVLLTSLTSVTASSAYATSPGASSHPAHQSFTVHDGRFYLDGKPFQIISGEMHYERIPRAYWKARLKMAKAMGLNTIATYVFWNIHEPHPGQYDFSGNADLAQFIRDAQQEGLKVLLRAGPYSCAEWEFGGFPAWLMKNPKMRTALRSNDPAFMQPVQQWIMRLGKEVAPLQIGNGGPIIAVQIENEYGDFGASQAYMNHLHQIFLKAGFTKSLLYTVNPSHALKNGHGQIPGVYAGVNFAPGNAKAAFRELETIRPGQPLFATEFWTGWFNHWGMPYTTKPIGPQVSDLNYILRRGASVNLYMFTGGSSFGMMSGASWMNHRYEPDITSYNYGAPLDEAGHPTPSYDQFRSVIATWLGHPLPPVPTPPPAESIPPFRLTQAASLWNGLPKPIHSRNPHPMSWYGQNYGFILYRITLHHPIHGTLLLPGLNDYAMIYVNGKLAGPLNRTCNQNQIQVHSNAPNNRIDVLVENDGRINSTRMMRSASKGVDGTVTLAGKPLYGWDVYTLPMAPDTIADPPAMPSEAHFTSHTSPALAMSGPAFYRGTFSVHKIDHQVPDTFLDVRNLGKGAVWINGHPIGRYWNIGPQDTLYVPGPWLHAGKNQIVVFDLYAHHRMPQLRGFNNPILNGSATPACVMPAKPSSVVSHHHASY